jgi:hypothetical protein
MDDQHDHTRSQQYDPSAMQTDSDLHTILAGMPTPVSNNIRATDQHAFMSPLQVDQQGFDRVDGVSFTTHRNDDVYPSR